VEEQQRRTILLSCAADERSRRLGLKWMRKSERERESAHRRSPCVEKPKQQQSTALQL
jgi:hypothetical protein